MEAPGDIIVPIEPSRGRDPEEVAAGGWISALATDPWPNGNRCLPPSQGEDTLGVTPEKARAIRKRGVLLATAGLLLALGIGAALQVLAEPPFHSERWMLATGLTLAVQAFMYGIVYFRFDQMITWDRHFVVTPMLAVGVLLDIYVYLSPELRDLVLMVWVVCPLFVAGLAGFRELLVIAAAMSSGYLMAMKLRISQGQNYDFGRESQVAIALFIVGLFSGIVLERLKNQRRETKRLRHELAELARTDELTGLANRRHFDQVLTAEIDRVTRYGGTCAVAIIDLDHFKRFNDQYGHPVGDAVLRRVSSLISAAVRGTDFPARIGGEEFGLVMVETDKTSATMVIERLRQTVEERPLLELEGELPLTLTLSAGIACCPDDANEVNELVARADNALYQAKDLGRNRVVVASASNEPAKRMRG
jgi:diguanylate cyclase (GGDEF)-like protein